MENLAIYKNFIRRINLNKRKNLTFHKKEKKDIYIFERLINLDEFLNSDVILSYVSILTEVDTINFIKYCFKKNKKIAVPVCDKGSNVMNFYYINDLKELKISNYSLLEPIIKKENLCCYNEKVKYFCVVPGLAYDISGNRIGYGKGYYDRFLSNFNCLKVGVCYDFNLYTKIKVNFYDVPMNLILTDKQIIKI